MNVQPTVTEIRAWASSERLRPSALARLAGLSPNALRDLHRPAWNPKASTLETVARAINERIRQGRLAA